MNKEDFKFIATVLEIFEGKISLSEILEMDHFYLSNLLDAKNKIDEEREKMREKIEAAHK